MPANTVKVSRPGKWGNPFKIGTHVRYAGEWVVITTKSQAVRWFRSMFSVRDRNYPSDAEIREELKGKNLACWCSLDGPCHADVLLEIANSESED